MKFTVNTAFNKQINNNFIYSNRTLEIVKKYKYLFLVFDFSFNFNQAIHNLHGKGLYILTKKVPYSNVPINIKLLNTMLLLLYLWM